MTFFLGIYSIYTNGFQIPHLKKKKKTRFRSGSPGSPGFGRAVATAGLLLNPDRSSHQADPPGRAGFNNGATTMNFFKKILFFIFLYYVNIKNKKILFTNKKYFKKQPLS